MGNCSSDICHFKNPEDDPTPSKGDPEKTGSVEYPKKNCNPNRIGNNSKAI
jgi:hypothetical protein